MIKILVPIFHFYFQSNCAEMNMKLMSIDHEEIFSFLPSLVYEVIKQKWYKDHEMRRDLGAVYTWWTNIQEEQLHNGKLMFWEEDKKTKKGRDQTLTKSTVLQHS